MKFHPKKLKKTKVTAVYISRKSKKVQKIYSKMCAFWFWALFWGIFWYNFLLKTRVPSEKWVFKKVMNYLIPRKIVKLHKNTFVTVFEEKKKTFLFCGFYTLIDSDFLFLKITLFWLEFSLFLSKAIYTKENLRIF